MGKRFEQTRDQRQYMDEKYTKKRSTPLIIREKQIKTMKRYHDLPIRLIKIKKKQTLPKAEVKDAEP